tara:strand:+ start:65 stop:331 length:267 start_codon:yes stop_codon:yes gene_type:complete
MLIYSQFQREMFNFSRKRIDVATCWATNRISLMDTLEKYEDSYAIAEEFREWILHIGKENQNLKNSVLIFPNELKELFEQKTNEKLIE